MYAKHLGRATFGAKSAQPNLSTFFSLAAYVCSSTGRRLLIHVTQEIRDIATLQCSKQTVYYQELKYFWQAFPSLHKTSISGQENTNKLPICIYT